MLEDKGFMLPHVMRVLSDRSDLSDLSDNTQKKRSIRQIDPAFVTAVTDYMGRHVDQLRDVFEYAAGSLRIVIIDERLPSDHLDPALSAEKLTGEAAFLLKITEFEHDSSLAF